jgi:hypothetical protein
MVDQLNFDAFSSGQMQSKLWLVQSLEASLDEYYPADQAGFRIWILAGWYGITNMLIRTRAKIRVKEVRSFDIDPSCEEIADKINNLWVWRAWEFKAHTVDINTLQYKPTPDIVINSSVEHMSENTWWNNIPKGTLVALQGSDMDHDDHNNKIKSSKELLEKYPLEECFMEGIKRFQYNDNDAFYRSMIIGVK